MNNPLDANLIKSLLLASSVMILSAPVVADDDVDARIAPVAKVHIAGETAPAPAAEPVAVVVETESVTVVEVSGANVYQSACFACHGTGAAGAPKLGDKAAWSARITKGNATLLEHAMNGFNAMPAKGGNMALTEAEITAAIEHMVSQSQ